MEIKRSVFSGLNVEKSLTTWTIKNFDVIRKSKEYIKLQQCTFKAGETIGVETEWRCLLHLSKRNNEDWIGCYLKLDSEPKISDLSELNAIFKLKAARPDRRGNLVCSTVLKPFLEDGQATRGWGFDFLRQDVDLNDLQLTDGCLTLELELQLFAPESLLKQDPGRDVASLKKNYELKFSKKLLQDLDKLLSTPVQNGDAETKIVTRDKSEFAVNRGVISARSPVFEKMFESRMTESKTGMIRITDISSKTMTVLLRFIYTGTLHKDWCAPDVIAELVYASDKYQLVDLFEFLSDVVGLVCTKENAGKLMNLAKKLSMRKAEGALFEFMKKNTLSFEDMVFFTQSGTDAFSPEEDESGWTKD